MSNNPLSIIDFMEKEYDVDVVEGDIIVFPAHWIHKGNINNKDRKTIISFNFDIQDLDYEWLTICKGKQEIFI